MTNPIFKERRQRDRRRLTGLLPGTLMDESRNNISARPVDLSDDGLGIISDTILQEGDTLILKLADRELLLTIAWVRMDFAKNNMYRYGLITSSDENLVQVFSDSNCLR